ncbi:hypothetical protein [Streptomyces sp900116325]|uniref:hypothetical protein n=1 Tax=Streptomyces sp. 900116325 TaxID=3154295 RepID=UPI0033DDB00E
MRAAADRQLQQCLAGDTDLLGGPAELIQPCGQLRDLLLRRLGLRGDLPFSLLQPHQRSEGQLPAGHALRQAVAVAPVSRRSITAVIAQYTRDSELRGRCS